jgi:NACHT domain
VPLRAYWREDLKDRKARTEERKHRLSVVDLDEAIEDWLNSAEHGDAIRLVSGGSGSGKSSFAKKLAADLAETSRMRALFFPLQRFPTRMPLPQAIETWLLGSGAFAENPIRQPEFASSTSRLLLIFDGLDELTKPGDLADEMTREFVQQVCTHVGIWNASERRVLVLVTGRTIVAEHYRQRLGVQEKQSLAVLPYLLENVDKDELARRQQAEIDDPLSRLGRDQRPIWWDKYTQAKGHPGVPLPEIFDESPDIKELTKEPLLNYLVILSKFHEQSAKESPKNRNEIYAMLLRDVLNRRHAKRYPKEPDPVLAGLDDVSDRETFERLLETIATAAWYGDGRTTTLKEARALCPSSSGLQLAETPPCA